MTDMDFAVNAAAADENVLPYVDFSKLRYSPHRAAEMLGVVPQTLKDLERDFGIAVERVQRGTAAFRAYSLDNIFEMAALRRQRGSVKGFARPIVLATYIQKGGTSKTTTAVSLAIQFGLMGLRVLLIDNDPQGDATTMLGYDPDLDEEELESLGVPPDRSVTGHLGNLMHLGDAVRKDHLEAVIRRPFGMHGPHIIPADCSLEDMDVVMRMVAASDFRYGMFLNKARDQQLPWCDLSSYDLVLIDNAPSGNMLSRNAMACADFIVCPIRMDKFSFKALVRLHEIVRTNADDLGRSPEVIAIPTMFVRGRPRAELNLEKINRFFPGKVTPPVYRSEDFEKSLEEGVPIPLWSPANNLTVKTQRELFQEVVSRIRAALDGGVK